MSIVFFACASTNTKLLSNNGIKLHNGRLTWLKSGRNFIFHICKHGICNHYLLLARVVIVWCYAKVDAVHRILVLKGYFFSEFILILS